MSLNQTDKIAFIKENFKYITAQDIDHVLIVKTDNLIDFKEALIFAFLGYRRVHNEINCLASVTGASKDHSSGIIYNL